MKITATLLLLLLSISGYSQVYGDIFMDKRGIAKDIVYEIYYSKPGKIVFDIAVDLEGNVTGCTLNIEKSTITSTVAVIKAKNKIQQNLKFKKGYKWPKFHQGHVQINTSQEKPEEDNRFNPPPE